MGRPIRDVSWRSTGQRSDPGVLEGFSEAVFRLGLRGLVSRSWRDEAGEQSSSGSDSSATPTKLPKGVCESKIRKRRWQWRPEKKAS